MSWEAVDAVAKRSKSKHGARLVLVMIAHHADRFGRNSYPSIKTLHDETGLEERHISRCIRALCDLGELSYIENGGLGLANVYTVLLVDNSVDNPGNGSRVVAQESLLNKEETAGVVTSETPSGDISSPGVMTPESSKHTVNHPEDLKGVDEEARARGEKFSGPITKAHSARRATHPQGEQPKEGAPPPDLPLPDGFGGLADIEALVTDPVLLAAAAAWLQLQGRSLETLTSVECAVLARRRAEWGKRFSPEDIRRLYDQAILRKPDVPHSWLLGALEKRATEAPGTGKGNGHARARAAPNGHTNGTGQAPHNGLDPREYLEPGGKYTAQFNPSAVVRRVITREEIIGGKQNK